MNYKDIINTYNYEAVNIEELYSSIAIEANVDDPNLTDIKKDTGQLVNKVKSLIDKIIAIIKNNIAKLGNYLKKFALTDVGFKKELREAEVSRKPAPSIKVIMYQYNNNILITAKNIMNSSINKILNDYSKATLEEGSPINMKNDEFNKWLFNTQLKAPVNITDIQTYLVYLRDKFRGKKQEKLIKGAELQNYIQIVDGYKNIKTEANKNMELIKNSINKLKTLSQPTAFNNKINEEQRSKRMMQLKSITIFYNIYCTFMNYYFEMKVEEMFAARVIIKKLYRL